MSSSATAATRARIKQIIVDCLNLEGVTPDSIEDDAPLFGEGLGLDSVDALELVMALERGFGIAIQSQQVGKEEFRSVATLAALVEQRLAAAGK